MGFLDDIKAGKQLKKTPKATEKKELADPPPADDGGGGDEAAHLRRAAHRL